jgi:hypothetical protein
LFPTGERNTILSKVNKQASPEKQKSGKRKLTDPKPLKTKQLSFQFPAFQFSAFQLFPLGAWRLSSALRPASSSHWMFPALHSPLIHFSVSALEFHF